jgi:hypothetical protein
MRQWHGKRSGPPPKHNVLRDGVEDVVEWICESLNSLRMPHELHISPDGSVYLRAAYRGRREPMESEWYVGTYCARGLNHDDLVGDVKDRVDEIEPERMAA